MKQIKKIKENEAGGLHVFSIYDNHRGEMVFFMGIMGSISTKWTEIPKSLYDELIKFEEGI